MEEWPHPLSRAAVPNSARPRPLLLRAVSGSVKPGLLSGGYAREPIDAHIVFSSGQRPSRKARAFSEYLSAILNAKD
jgi:hypothetical protein